MTQRRGGLGRGLEALIPAAPAGEQRDYALIPVGDISPNPNQPRRRFDDEALATLSESIGAVGVLQPIVVTPAGDDSYRIVAGERRWRAAKRAGLTEVPAMIRAVDDQTSLTDALIENLQREDLSPLEEAAAYQQLLEEYGMTHDEVGSHVGKSRVAVTNTVRLLQLPPAIQGMLERRELTAGHARALLGIDDTKYAEHVAKRAVEEGWSVRQVEDAARIRRQEENPTPAKPVIREVRPVEIIELEQRLTERLGSRVKISYRQNKGRVQIDFRSLDDLERLYRTFFS